MGVGAAVEITGALAAERIGMLKSSGWPVRVLSPLDGMKFGS